MCFHWGLGVGHSYSHADALREASGLGHGIPMDIDVPTPPRREGPLTNVVDEEVNTDSEGSSYEGGSHVRDEYLSLEVEDEEGSAVGGESDNLNDCLEDVQEPESSDDEGAP